MSAIVDFPVKPEARPYLDAFEGRVADRAPLAQHRRRGLTRFAEAGFPSRKSESWRYLDLQPLARQPLLPAAARSAEVLRAMGDHLTGLLLPGKGPRLVLVDGHFAAEFSSLDMPQGVWFGPTSAAIVERPALLDAVAAEIPGDSEHPFAALNAAFFAGGYVLEIAPGVVLDAPSGLIHLGPGAVARSLHTRRLAAMGDGSRDRPLEADAR